MHTNTTGVTELDFDVAPVSPPKTPAIFYFPIPDSLSNQKHIMGSFIQAFSYYSSFIIF